MNDWQRSLRAWKDKIKAWFAASDRSGHRPKIKMCPSCGNFVGVNDVICGYCDTPLKAQPGPSADTGSSGIDPLNPITIIAGLCVVIHLIAVYLSSTISDYNLSQNFWSPHSKALIAMGANFNLHTIDRGELWRVATYMLLHGGFMHILFNIMAFAQLGPLTLSNFGRRRFWLITLATGVLGGVASMLAVVYTPIKLSVGFSGVLFGYLGANYIYMRSQGQFSIAHKLKQYMIWGNLIFIALTVTNLFPIDNLAHLGGMFTGLGLGAVFQSRWTRMLNPLVEKILIGALSALMLYGFYKAFLYVDANFINIGA